VRAVAELEHAVSTLVPVMAGRTDEELQRMTDAFHRLMPHVIFERVYRGHTR